MLLAYPEGADLTLLQTMYQYPRKNPETGKYSKPVLTLVYKNNMTGDKEMEEIVDPDYEFYIANDDIELGYNHLFIDKDKVHKITCKYSDLEKKIADVTDNLDFYYQNIKSANRGANKALHTNARIFMSDTNIEDHYRFRFSNLYTNNIVPITKSFLDIETDIIDMKGDFPELGECPINVITVIMEQINKTYTLILRNPDNPLIQEFEDSVGPVLYKQLKMFIQNQVGGPDKEKKYKLDNMDYQFLFYDEEIQLIYDIFALINKVKPDFLLAWNMAFDIPYIIERIKNLGYDPKEIMCHPDFHFKKVNYFVDERMKDLFAERGDFCDIASYTVFLDQLIHFASRRKSQSAFKSFKLDDIGEAMVGVKKVDYKHITPDLAKLPYIDFLTFIFYNIGDTIVQKCIESKVGDIEYLFGKCVINNTRYHKGHRQTVYLTNRGAKEFYNDGFVMGNNPNRGNSKPEEKYPGAYVGDPNKLSDYAKLKINGNPINVFDNLDDFDYKSLYPSIMREFNIAPHTQIGRIIIDEPVHDKENRFDFDKYVRGGAFLDELQTQSYLEFCSRWLHMGTYENLIDDIISYFNDIKSRYRSPKIFDTNGNINMIHFINPDVEPPKFISYHEDDKPIRVFQTYQPINKEKLNEILDGYNK